MHFVIGLLLLGILIYAALALANVALVIVMFIIMLPIVAVQWVIEKLKPKKVHKAYNINNEQAHSVPDHHQAPVHKDIEAGQ